jgi:hypothetical protein
MDMGMIRRVRHNMPRDLQTHSIALRIEQLIGSALITGDNTSKIRADGNGMVHNKCLL